MKKIEDLKKGEFFRMREGAKKTYEFKGYCRINRKYEGGNYDDISDSKYIKKGTPVFTNFEF